MSSQKQNGHRQDRVEGLPAEPRLDDAVEMAIFTAQAVGESEAATFVAALDGTIVSWSEAAERLFRRASWEVLGRPCHEVVRGLGLDGSPGCRADCPIRTGARLGKTPLSRDFVVEPRPEGSASTVVRVQHVTLRDPVGYPAALLHLVEAVPGPRRRPRR